MSVREGRATWEGSLKDGRGKIAFGQFEKPYSFRSRFEDGDGTNPEELIAAAHAGCFSMALSHILSGAGHTPQRVSTTARVHLEKAGDGFAIPTIELRTEAAVPGIQEAAFKKFAQQAKENCPVSKVLAGAAITLEARLLS